MLCTSSMGLAVWFPNRETYMSDFSSYCTIKFSFTNKQTASI